MEKIGVLGGTFNPVHKEHYSLAISAIKELGLNKLFVMPTFLSPHKSSTPVAAEHRKKMLEIAFQGEPNVEVSDYEIINEGKSYTYKTVEYFKAQGYEQVYFIIGGDMLTDFKTWRYPERILSACTLAVFERENFHTDFDVEREYLKTRFNKDFVKLEYVGKDASSTKIRVYSAYGLGAEEYLPKGVNEYIVKNGLYAPDKYEAFVKERLPKKRIRHTADVVICAMKKAKALNLDENKVKLAATLHDVAKYLDYESVEGFTLPNGVPQPVIHSFLGAFVAEKYLGVSDQEVLDAIRYHTSGKAEMSLLGKLIFVADMVEEGRDYEGVDKLRALYETDDFEKCFVECLKEEFLHLINKKQYIYEETLNAFKYYVKN